MGWGRAELSRLLTGTVMNVDVLESSVPDNGQEHGHWSQNICGFLGKGGGGETFLSPTLGLIW